MSASHRAEVVFEYQRDAEGTYTGSVRIQDPDDGDSDRPPLQVVLKHPEWVRFVVETIKQNRDIRRVCFTMRKADNTTHQYRLDARTVDQIKDETLRVEDLIL
jgi:hypothetical protein